jgi:hypothetical protein
MKTTPTNTLKVIGNWLRAKPTIPGIAAGLLLCQSSAFAGHMLWDFDTTDPTKLAVNPLAIYQVGFQDSTGTNIYWKPAGGNPATGGFLGVCWPIGSSSTVMLFPDIDSGGVVSSFTLTTDMRAGNPQQNPLRSADGFSLNFARKNDPVFASHSTADMASPGQPENGTSTGLAVSFDTWAGNTLPGGEADIEGIIVRVDNVTVLKYAMPTRNGACADATSIQTGPEETAFWTFWKTNGFNQSFSAVDTNAVPPVTPDAAYIADSWSNLCWQPLSVELDLQSKLTVKFKGVSLLDHVQTSFFPSAGGLILAGRTGGADEHAHFDNMDLTTTAGAADTVPPTQPTGLATVGTVGSTRVQLSWNPSTDNSGRVAYELSRLSGSGANTVSNLLIFPLSDTNYLDYPPAGGVAYTYSLRAVDVNLNYAAPVTLVVTPPANTPVIGTVLGQTYDHIGGVTVNDLLQAPDYNANAPSRAIYGLGLTFGSVNGNGWNNSFGENYGFKATGQLVPTVSGNYTFYIRCDDGAAFYLGTDSTIPDPAFGGPTVSDQFSDTADGCCHPFLEPNDPANTGPMTQTNIALVAGTSYGFTLLFKEGGGGDGVAVGMKIDGDPTAAINVPPIGGMYVRGVGDTVGSALAITTQPAPVTVIANEATTMTVAATHTNNYQFADVWYQWLKNGAPIPGQISSTLTIPVAALADNQAQITAVVGTEGLVQTSQVAVLTVTPDTKPPTIKSAAQSDSSFTTITVKFSEPVTAPTATTTSNYVLNNGATVSAAALSADGFTVTLTTSALTVGGAYTLTVNNVADNAGNPIAANTVINLNAWVKVLSAVNIAFFGNINNTTVDNLTNDSRFPNTPDSTWVNTNNPAWPNSGGLEIGSRNGLGGWNNSFGANFGMYITGTLTPPVTGDWNFFIRSDDSSALFLNTTGASLPGVGGAGIAYEPGCCNTFQEPGTAAQTTTSPIHLTAGTQYGFVVLLKEGGGGDGVAVGMRQVGDTTPAANVASIGTYAPIPAPIVSNPTLSVGMVGGSVVITYTGTLNSSTSVNGAYTPVAGATSPYTVPNTGAPGAMFFRSK